MNSKLYKDKIPGGLAKGMSLNDIAKKHSIKNKLGFDNLKKAFNDGMKVEMEHTTDKSFAKEIVLDHLFEDPKYYIKLKKVEEKDKNLSESDINRIIKKVIVNMI